MRLPRRWAHALGGPVVFFVRGGGVGIGHGGLLFPSARESRGKTAPGSDPSAKDDHYGDESGTGGTHVPAAILRTCPPGGRAQTLSSRVWTPIKSARRPRASFRASRRCSGITFTSASTGMKFSRRPSGARRGGGRGRRRRRAIRAEVPAEVVALGPVDLRERADPVMCQAVYLQRLAVCQPPNSPTCRFGATMNARTHTGTC